MNAALTKGRKSTSEAPVVQRLKTRVSGGLQTSGIIALLRLLFCNRLPFFKCARLNNGFVR